MCRPVIVQREESEAPFFKAKGMRHPYIKPGAGYTFHMSNYKIISCINNSFIKPSQPYEKNLKFKFEQKQKKTFPDLLI